MIRSMQHCIPAPKVTAEPMHSHALRDMEYPKMKRQRPTMDDSKTKYKYQPNSAVADTRAMLRGSFIECELSHTEHQPG